MLPRNAVFWQRRVVALPTKIGPLTVNEFRLAMVTFCESQEFLTLGNQ